MHLPYTAVKNAPVYLKLYDYFEHIVASLKYSEIMDSKNF